LACNVMLASIRIGYHAVQDGGRRYCPHSYIKLKELPNVFSESSNSYRLYTIHSCLSLKESYSVTIMGGFSSCGIGRVNTSRPG
jgi:hypothetical protein